MPNGTPCDHQRCQENSHCILDALWLNPGEFEHEEPIRVAAQMQEEFWGDRRVWKAKEAVVAATLWQLVDAGGGHA